MFKEEILEKIVAGFASKIGYKRATEIEAWTGLGLCYNISGLRNTQWPTFAFHFKGGADMVLPVSNYFTHFRSLDSTCLTMVSSKRFSDDDNGPAVILGNYQQQNFYILFDREKNRLGFTQQTCKTFG